MINLHIEPKVTQSWQEFLESKPPYSMALDGYVTDSTKRNTVGPYANFDHHSNVDRISTRSTAEQVFMEINLGLFDVFRKDGMPHAEIYVNDCDEDTILAVWLLMNNERIKQNSNPLINKLIYCNDKLDATGGAYPFGDIALLRKMAWMFEPYRNARSQKRLAKMGCDDMRCVIDAVLSRISEYVMGAAKELPIETHYEIMYKGTGWSMVKESSTAARMIMFSSGIHAFVSFLEEGRFVIGRRSTWTDFPLDEIYKYLNDKEGYITWGGSNTIGGSLRGNGSKFTKEELTVLIEDFLKTNKSK